VSLQLLKWQACPTVPELQGRLSSSQVGATFRALPCRWKRTQILESNQFQGANSILGIGRASAFQFAENGARAIYICDYDDSNLAAHKKDIEATWPNVEVHARQFDAADEKAIKEVVNDALQRYGRLDVFFANAGIIGPHGLFADIEAEGFMETMRVNSLGLVTPFNIPKNLDLDTVHLQFPALSVH